MYLHVHVSAAGGDPCRNADGKEILSETAMRSLLKRVDLQHLEDRAGGFFEVDLLLHLELHTLALWVAFIPQTPAHRQDRLAVPLQAPVLALLCLHVSIDLSIQAHAQPPSCK